MRIPPILIAVASTAALSLAPAAQTTSADPSRDLSLWVRAPGPAGLLEAFAETEVVQTFEGAEMAEFRAAVLDGWADLAASASAEGVELQPIVEALLEHSGTVTIAGRLDGEALFAWLRDGDSAAMGRAFSVVVRFSDDGSSDLDALAERIVTLVEDAKVPLVETASVDGGLAMVDEDALGVLLPTRIDDQLVVVISGGDDFDGRLPGLLERGVVPAAEQGAAPFEVFVSASLLRSLVELPFQPNLFYGGVAPGTILGEILDPLRGFLDLDNAPDVSLQIRPEEERIRVEMSAAVDAGRSSLLDLLRPSSPGPLSLLRLVPRDHPMFASYFVDLGELFERIAAFGRRSERFDAADIEAGFTEFSGFDLRQDLLARLTGEVVTLDDSQQVWDEVREDFEQDELPGGLTLAIGLSDTAGFAEMLEKILRKQGLHAARKRAEYRGVDLFTLNLFGLVTVDYGFVDGALLIGQGEIGGQTVRRVVDRGLDVDAADGGGWPDVVRERVAILPDAWQMLSVSRTTLSADDLQAALEAALDGEDMPEQLQRILRAMFAGMARVPEAMLTQVDAMTVRDGVLRITTIW